jgi:hypothetical protein
MKLAPKIFFANSDRPYMASAHGGDEDLSLLWHSAIPGHKLVGGVHQIPAEMIPRAVQLADNCGFASENGHQRDIVSISPTIKRSYGKRPYEPQKWAATKILEEGRYMINFEMGLGKTLVAILAMKGIKAKSVLIVCPAMVRLVWEDEFGKWWKKHPDVFVFDEGKKKLDNSPIVITSYALLPKLFKLRPTGWDFIVADECHYLENSSAGRSYEFRKVTIANPNAYLPVLSATPITNEPANLQNQLDILWPGRVGSMLDFLDHHAERKPNPYAQRGFDYFGLNDVYADELRERLSHMAYRLTKHEMAEHMPPFVISTIRVKVQRSFNVRDLTNQLLRTDRHNVDIRSSIIGRFGAAKQNHAAEWAYRAAKSGDRVCVLTHLKRTAKGILSQIGRENKGGVTLFGFDGDTPIPKRRKIVELALKTSRSVLCCTMHSVKEGLNTMAGFDDALLAELYYTPGVMSQVAGRFHRLSGACNLALLTVEGSWEEIVAERLRKKMEAAGALQRSGVAEEELIGALNEEEDEDEAFAKLRLAAAGRLEEDVYA